MSTNGKPDLSNPDPVAMVLDLANYHHELQTWKDKSDWGWLSGILEEVSELASSLDGEHEHPPEFEAAQIAACAINYLRWRRGKIR